jgi:glycosyltransferase involved in cell wall biosynthesis
MRVRSLVIARVEPWPIDRGSRIRVVSTVRALSTTGAVDLVGLTSDSVSGVHDAPDGEPISQWHAIRMNIERSALVRSGRLVLGAAPRALAVQDLAETRAQLRTWTDQPYDLIWFYRAEALAIANPDMGRPVIVDLDDLDYVKIESNRGAIGGKDGRREGGFLREQAKRFVESREGPRWWKLQRAMAHRARLALLASHVDRDRLGVSGVEVLPNTYPRPVRVPGPQQAAVGQILLFVGHLGYAPNRDAVRYLSRDIVPLVRAGGCTAEFRVVGGGGEQLESECPNVVFSGSLESVGPQLAEADLVVAPLRFGSGTRMKILEAFANHIPVVATSLGAEGLHARDGHHLVLADDPRAFADACRRLLRDRELRETLAAAAYELWLEHYSPEVFTARVRELVDHALG